MLTFKIHKDALKEEMRKRVPTAMAVLMDGEYSTREQREVAVAAVLYERQELLKKEGFAFDGEKLREPFDMYIDPFTDEYVFRQGVPSETAAKVLAGIPV